MVHNGREQSVKVALDALSPEKVTSAQTAGKIVTSSTAELDFNGCAMELLPYYPNCDPRPGIHTPG